MPQSTAVYSLLGAALLNLSLPAASEVIGNNSVGFHLKIEATTVASPSATYAKFSDIGSWWSEDHTWFGKGENLSLVLEPGGCFCEIEGDKTVQHLQVSFVDPGKRVVMLGGLGPLQRLGLYGAATFTFEGTETGGTKIVHEYRVSGYYPEGFDNLAKIVDSVQQLQVDNLVASLAASSN